MNKYVREYDFNEAHDLVQIAALKEMAYALDNELNASLVAQFQKAFAKLEESRTAGQPAPAEQPQAVDPLLLPE